MQHCSEVTSRLHWVTSLQGLGEGGEVWPGLWHQQETQLNSRKARLFPLPQERSTRSAVPSLRRGLGGSGR